MREDCNDRQAITALIRRQFESLSWSSERQANWAQFAADFLPDAPLHGAARPVRPQTVDAFVKRMRQLADTSLRSLDERLRGVQISVFGNVAIAMSVCELVENGTTHSRNVEAMLLVKDGDEWRIAAQAWDSESATQPIPTSLLSEDGA